MAMFEDQGKRKELLGEITKLDQQIAERQAKLAELKQAIANTPQSQVTA
jgi:cell division protein FtsL